MPERYGVLKGIAHSSSRDDDKSTHYHLLVSTPNTKGRTTLWRCPINIRSKLPDQAGSHELLFYIDKDLLQQRDPKRALLWQKKTAALAALPLGFHAIHPQDGLGLDYIREAYFAPNEMSSLPANLPGPSNDLQDLLSFYVKRATENAALVYLFGARFDNQDRRAHERGMHNIHMNQGNTNHFAKDNGTFQDGGVLFELLPPRETPRWVGFFSAFKTQQWGSAEV